MKNVIPAESMNHKTLLTKYFFLLTINFVVKQLNHEGHKVHEEKNIINNRLLNLCFSDTFKYLLIAR